MFCHFHGRDRAQIETDACSQKAVERVGIVWPKEMVPLGTLGFNQQLVGGLEHFF